MLRLLTEYFTFAPPLCPHLQVNISDPFDDSMRGPYQWINVLVLTLYPASLECLETILINTFYIAERFTCITSICSYHMHRVYSWYICFTCVHILTYLLVEIEQV